MNISKNGIPIYHENNNPSNQFATLFRVEEFTPVWLVVPFKWKEIKSYKSEGWRIIEVWEPES